MKYKQVSLGGTFDRLHTGHKHFLRSAFEESEFVTIGITVNGFSKEKSLFGITEGFEIRKSEVINFLDKKGFESRYVVIPLKDIYGNTVSEKNVDAIFVTEESIGNAFIINKKREEKGYPPLTIVEISLIKGDDGQIISSTRIRSGEIDRAGKKYIKIFDDVGELVLPGNIREELQKPFGTVMKDIPEIDANEFIIAVGDITVSKFTEKGSIPNISIFDYKTKRHEISNDIRVHLPTPSEKLVNRAGVIEGEAVRRLGGIIRECIFENKKSAIEIVGEEDLLSLPAILLSPLGSKVYYGLRNVGMIEINITEESKKGIGKKYLEKFISKT